MEQKVQDRIDEELLRMSAEQVRHAPATILFSMGIIAYLIFRHFPDQPLIWAGWFALTIIAQAARWQILRRMPEETQTPPGERLKRVERINLANTLVHMLSFIAFPIMTPFEASVLTMIFLGMGTGSIVTTLGYRPFAQQYLFVALIPLFMLWLWSGVFGPGGILGVLVSLVGLAFVASMTLICERLYQMAEELYSNRESLAVALEEAEAAGLSKTRFLAAASHDLRQPIHSLSLFVGALGLQNLAPRSEQLVGKMDEAVRALSLQMDALLDISKLDAGVMPVHREVVDLSAMLHRISAEFSQEAQQNFIVVTIQAPPQALASSDPQHLERIVRNLIGNAVTHNTDCSLYISVSAQPAAWRVEFKDTGVGISAEQQGKVFDEFYQVHNPERDRTKGLGLGLSIVRRLASLLDIDLHLESAPEVGTSFRFDLPAAEEAAPETDGHPQAATSVRGLRILVLDDEESIRIGMAALLTSLGGEVQAVESTASAVVCCEDWEPSVALVDFRLRENSSGLQAIEALRVRYPTLPAILISGDTNPSRLQEADRAGITLLHKPVETETLITTIHEVCNR